MKLNYSHYNDFLKKYSEALTTLKTEIESYISYIESCTKSGVISGAIHDELLIYTDHVKKTPELIVLLSEKIDNVVKNYLADMNDAQCRNGKYILYAKHYCDTRNYTDENFDSLESICDSSDHDANVFEIISDIGENVLAGVINYLGNTFSWFNARQTQYLVMEKNDITRTKLREIQLDLKNTESYYRNIALDLAEHVDLVYRYISTLFEIMSSDPNGFSMDNFAPRLSLLREEIINGLNSIDVDATITDADIKEFAELDNAEDFFKDQSDVIYDYLAKLSQTEWYDWDFWKMVIMEQFDIASHKLRYLFGNDYDYDDYLRDRDTLNLINEVAETKEFDDRIEKEILDSYKIWMTYIEKHGDGWELILDGVKGENGKLLLDKRTRKYKIFKETFDQFERAGEITDYGIDICEVVAHLCADYEKNLAMLDSLERNFAAEGDMADSIARIRSEYEKSFDSIALMIYNKASQYGEKFIKKNIDKLLNISVFQVVGVIQLGIEATGTITGMGADSQAMMQLLSGGYDQMNSAKTAYENSLAALNACSPDSENYAACVEDFKNCFNYYKVTMKRIYEKMALTCTGKESDYYEYCANELDDLTIKNHDRFDIMTLEEYLAL